MKNLFDIKKDISQFKETKEKIEEASKRIEQKAPLIASTGKSIFVILKWFVILGIIFFISYFIYHYAYELPREKAYRERIDSCWRQCNHPECIHPEPGELFKCDRPSILEECHCW
jgi:hypothetical protein